MLEIYVGEDSLPKDRKFIYDAESVFNGFCDSIPLDEETDCILQFVEHGTYQDDKTFVDRFGRGLYYSCLSTGSKILLLAKMYPEWIINFTEAGYNCLTGLESLKSASIYIPRVEDFDLQVERDDLIINGVRYYSTNTFNEAMEDLKYGNS